MTLSPHRRTLHTLTLAGLGALSTLGTVACHTSAASDDGSLTTAVMAKLHGDSVLNSEPIQASVQSGVATLTGAVSSPAARSLAANDVAQVPGIRTVVNDLSLAQAPSAVADVSTPPPTPVPSITPAPITAVRDKKKPSASVPDRRRTSTAAPIERQPPPQPAPEVARNVPPPPPPTPSAPPPPPQPTFRNVTIPAGTTLPVRINKTLDSATTQQGDTFTGTLAADVLVDGLVAIPQGSSASGRVDTVQEAAHFKGNSLLSIEITGISRHGDQIPITTAAFSKEGAGRGKNTAEKVGGGAAVGAILGGIFGGGRGAAIGAAAGGGVGAGANTVTRGQQVQIPSETLVNFKLSSPVSVRVRTSGDSNRPASGTSPDVDTGQRRPLSPSSN